MSGYLERPTERTARQSHASATRCLVVSSLRELPDSYCKGTNFDKSRPNDGWDGDCPNHGLERHVLVHEAGHALAAIEFGVPFLAIELRELAHEGAQVTQLPAEVKMRSRERVWVNEDRVAALKFLSAGQLAEAVVLGDIYSSSAASDWRTFREGTGAPKRPLTDAEFDELVGPPGREVIADQVETWASSAQYRIDALARFLAETPAPAHVSWDQVVGFCGRAGWLALHRTTEQDRTKPRGRTPPTREQAGA